MKVIEKNKIFLSVIACMFLLFFAIEITRQYIASADDATTMPNGSFAVISSAACDFLNQYAAGIISRDKTIALRSGDREPTIPKVAGKAGGLLGYSESVISPDSTIANAIFNINTRGEGVYDYDAMANSLSRITIYRDKDGNLYEDVSKGDSFVVYCHFGYTLKELGLDQTGFNGFDSSLRQITGIFVIVLYLLTAFLGEFWDLVIGVLNLANPFYLFQGSENPALMQNLATYHADAMARTESTVAGYISSGISQMQYVIGELYDKIQELSLTLVLPFSIALGLFVWLVIKHGREPGKVFKNTIIKCFFTVLGIPLLLLFYATALGFVSNLHEEGRSLGNNIIKSTFMDFEAWSKSRLDLPDGYDLIYDKKTHTVDKDVAFSVRDLTLFLNNSHNDNFKKAAASRVAALDDTYGFYDYDSEAIESFKKDTLSSDLAESSAILDMLERYARSEKISASSFENYEKLRMDFELFPMYLSLSDTWQEFDKTRIYQYEILNGGSFVNTLKKDSKYSIFTISDWNLELYNMCSSRFSYPTRGEISPDHFIRDMVKHESCNIFGNGSLIAAGDDTERFIEERSDLPALSTMAMYNYLSSVFDESSVTVYSADNTSNNASKAEHYAVNLVGSPFMQTVYFFDIITVFAAFTVVGYSFGFSLLLANFRSMIKIVPYVFTSSLGTLHGIGMCIVIVFSLIAEILVTCLLYNLSVQFISGLYALIQKPLSKLISTVLGDVDSTGLLFSTLSGAVSTFIMVMMIGYVLRYRYAIVQFMSEACASVVNKFLHADVSAVSLSKVNPSAAGVASSAALVGGGLLGIAGKGESKLHSIGERLGLASHGAVDGAASDNGGTTIGQNGLAMLSANSSVEQGSGVGYTNKSDEEIAAGASAYDGKSDSEIVDANKDFFANDGENVESVNSVGQRALESQADASSTSLATIETENEATSTGHWTSSFHHMSAEQLNDEYDEDYDDVYVDVDAEVSDDSLGSSHRLRFSADKLIDMDESLDSEDTSMTATGEDGQMYLIHASRNADGSVSYSMETIVSDVYDNNVTEITSDMLRVNDNGTVSVELQTGEVVTLSVDNRNNEQGIETFKSYAGQSKLVYYDESDILTDDVSSADYDPISEIMSASDMISSFGIKSVVSEGYTNMKTRSILSSILPQSPSSDILHSADAPDLLVDASLYENASSADVGQIDYSSGSAGDTGGIQVVFTDGDSSFAPSSGDISSDLYPNGQFIPVSDVSTPSGIGGEISGLSGMTDFVANNASTNASQPVVTVYGDMSQVQSDIESTSIQTSMDIVHNRVIYENVDNSIDSNGFLNVMDDNAYNHEMTDIYEENNNSNDVLKNSGGYDIINKDKNDNVGDSNLFSSDGFMNKFKK